ncbi:Uncharacterized conserved protein [Bradyrhizobium brasilense]|uniref:Uncharacterized conserved protein n=1 Tax=Bradyrhizobium brasilense TaxID=1419277 RepID=A0A1G6IIL9_9BRAD|nr:DUF2163 domain-containing protein [Bradyrhizobium brasilense]SDC06338.1 Uncharacterized conserved protein [Bradyrhizobium brasilense]
MFTYSFNFVGSRSAFLLTITRRDGLIIRLTDYGRPITIDGVTWMPGAGLAIGDITENNDGDEPTGSFKVATQDDGVFNTWDISNRLFEGAEALIEITDARISTTKDYEFSGLLKSPVGFDLAGNAQFEILNKFALQRDVFVRQYSVEDDVDFGDPRRNKIPTFPTVDPTSDDLADVARSALLEVGDRRRFRYGSDGNPGDYHDVYWEVTAITTGVTGASVPSSPSDTPDDTVTDGGVTFTVRNAYARAFQVASIIDDRHITISVTEPRASGVTTWFAPGLLVMRSGYCNNRPSDIDAWDGISQVELVVPFGGLLAVGDWGEIAPDYDETLDMAVEKYGAAIGLLADGGANNYRGIPHLTGSKVATSTYVPGTTVDTPTDGGDGGGGDPGGGGGYTTSAVEFAAGST